MAQEDNKIESAQAVSWTASEYIDHQQGARWFLMLSGATIVLAGLIYLISKDIFSVVIILLLGIITGVFARRTPKQRQDQMTESGFSIDDKNYPYSSFKSFYILQEGALTSLNFVSVKRFMPPISIYFNPADQEKIVNLVQDHLAYEQHNLDPVERLSRSLHF